MWKYVGSMKKYVALGIKSAKVVILLHTSFSLYKGPGTWTRYLRLIPQLRYY